MDKAISSLLAESGLRLSELEHVKKSDIDWATHTIRVIGKEHKDGYAPFGKLTEHYQELWLKGYKPKPNQCMWDSGFWGIKSMLLELSDKTGLPFNPHTFRRTFTSLLGKQGIDSLTIKDLVRWEDSVLSSF